MSPRRMIKNLVDTPFSQNRLIIWALGFSMIFSLVFIFVLAYQKKDIPPSLAMATGIVINEFARSLRKANK